MPIPERQFTPTAVDESERRIAGQGARVSGTIRQRESGCVLLRLLCDRLSESYPKVTEPTRQDRVVSRRTLKSDPAESCDPDG